MATPEEGEHFGALIGGEIPGKSGMTRFAAGPQVGGVM